MVMQRPRAASTPQARSRKPEKRTLPGLVADLTFALFAQSVLAFTAHFAS